MHSIHRRLACAATVLMSASASAQELLAVDSTNDRIMLLSAVDGSLLNASFINLASGGGTPPGLPIQAISNGAGEIWVSDQTADVIYRWSADGSTYLGQFGTTRDNIRGIHIDFGRLWVCNAGTAGGSFGNAVKEYDLAFNLIAGHPYSGSPFGIASLNGELIVTDSTNDRLVRVKPATGLEVGVLHDSDGVSGVDFPGQLNKTQAGNMVTVGLIAPVGIFEYSPAGVELNYFATPTSGGPTTPQGVHELLNGNFVVGAGNGLWLYNRTTGVWSTIVTAIDANYISPRSGFVAPPSAYCTAGTSTNGCVPALSASANPSASGASACVLSVAALEGQKQGLVFYGLDNSGFTPLPWSGTSTSFFCVKSPTQRTLPQSSGGTNGACDGAFSVDWNAFLLAFPTALGAPFAPGDKLFAQAWYRDPPAPKTTNLSNGLELTFVP
jgi:hypothetical protein